MGEQARLALERILEAGGHPDYDPQQTPKDEATFAFQRLTETGEIPFNMLDNIEFLLPMPRDAVTEEEKRMKKFLWGDE